MQVISAGVQDQDRLVRSAGAFALGHLAEQCQPEIIAHTPSILPVVFTLLKDPDSTVQEQACYALQAVCENLRKPDYPSTMHVFPFCCRNELYCSPGCRYECRLPNQ